MILVIPVVMTRLKQHMCSSVSTMYRKTKLNPSGIFHIVGFKAETLWCTYKSVFPSLLSSPCLEGRTWEADSRVGASTCSRRASSPPAAALGLYQTTQWLNVETHLCQGEKDSQMFGWYEYWWQIQKLLNLSSTRVKTFGLGVVFWSICGLLQIDVSLNIDLFTKIFYSLDFLLCPHLPYLNILLYTFIFFYVCEAGTLSQS